jgi:ATP-dependent RNA helicase RhlB
MKFTELNLPEVVLQGIANAGFEKLTPVQEESIPLALQGKDVAAQAQTGTGKTACKREKHQQQPAGAGYGTDP